jgi:hypothetical protein
LAESGISGSLLSALQDEKIRHIAINEIDMSVLVFIIYRNHTIIEERDSSQDMIKIAEGFIA